MIDKELEIRLQFLEEATEYLNIIESGILGLATTQVDNQRMDAVLRAAHSIKGGAAMMGFQTLSQIAHRLEDFFKVLKNNKPAVDGELESLLLTAVSRLRQVITLHHGGTVVDNQWLDTHVNPVFEQLNQRLGDSTSMETTPELPEDGQNMVSLIFESEVEAYLQQLEAILADPEKPQLLEELINMAQDLGGLGEMLQIPNFTSLCASVIQHLETSPERVEKIARLALQEWRRSQAALLIGQVDTLVAQINLDTGTEVATIQTTARENLLDQILTADIEIPHPQELNDLLIPDAKSNIHLDLKTVHLSLQSDSTPSPNLNKDTQENTVRVSVKLLDQLNDLFGELTIERNGLNLYLERLRNLIKTLSRRVRSLRSLDTRLEINHQQVATKESVVSLIPSLEQEATAPKIVHSDNDNFDLEINRNRNSHPLSNEVIEDIVRIQEVTDDITLNLEDTDQTVTELNRTAKQLQTNLTQVRMRPLSDLVGRFPLFLRELSLQYGKNVELKIHGGGTLIERTILEALNDPLMHLLRNAFDHGIEDTATRLACGKPEQGMIEIKAAHQGNQTLITVRDDGGGIDLDKIRRKADQLSSDPAIFAAASDQELLSLMFEPGFSTADQVTDLSGRGVGLDVVRTNLREIRGDIKVDTQLGVGTTFTLSVPLSLSVARVLLVESNNILLAFPSDAIAEVLLLNPEQISSIGELEIYSCEGYIMPLIRLGNWLQIHSPHKKVDSSAVPVMNAPTVLKIAQSSDWIAIQIDRCWGEQEVAIREVEGARIQEDSDIKIAMPPGFSSCAILGDGRVVPLVNVPELLELIASFQEVLQDKQPVTPTEYQHQKDTILVVDDSINVRRFLSLTLEKAGYRVEEAQDGEEGIEKLSTGLPIKAVICDVDMPRLDGYSFLARVKSNSIFKNLPIMMLTSRSADKDRQIAMNLGATAYFTKPYNEQELIETLKQLIP
ncbi:MAG: hybrid sensor histidine kinase/response regulator [Gloeocapsa sp. UFS-A4-WI-NPMV-4B04]|jgi:chemosensory pili system protein ChpA (sensor histidine kinase/response regulator)|nr:hybrid sensor histidine kinase/response regulator [Gloeocapsa sp. UFS-A4-WI-NPMV-4B04]